MIFKSDLTLINFCYRLSALSRRKIWVIAKGGNVNFLPPCNAQNVVGRLGLKWVVVYPYGNHCVYLLDGFPMLSND
jgi:hypothetical protein